MKNISVYDYIYEEINEIAEKNNISDLEVIEMLLEFKTDMKEINNLN